MKATKFYNHDTNMMIETYKAKDGCVAAISRRSRQNLHRFYRRVTGRDDLK